MRKKVFYKGQWSKEATMSINKVTVLGGGNGAHAIAANLSLAGLEVNMYELPQFKENIRATARCGGIEITGAAKVGFAKLNKITTDIKEAVKDADLIMIVVPAFGQKTFAEVCAPHLEDGQMVVLTPGNLGSIVFANVLREKGIREDITIAETATLPYGARLTAPAQVKVSVLISPLPIAAFPAKYNEKVIKDLKKIYPVLVPATNVIETALNNVNSIIHTPPAILNTGRIEYSKGEFYLYKEGVTPSVARVIEAIDRERQAVCDALGLNYVTIEENLFPWGQVRARTVYELVSTSVKISDVLLYKGPTSMQHRMITEDVPYGLVLTASLGDMVNIDTPVTKSLIRIASEINHTDYFKEGRTVDKLGIAGLSIPNLNKFMKEGEV